MKSAMTNDGRYKAGARVVLVSDAFASAGVPEGTLGIVKLDDGSNWIPYRVEFATGDWLWVDEKLIRPYPRTFVQSSLF